MNLPDLSRLRNLKLIFCYFTYSFSDSSPEELTPLSARPSSEDLFHQESTDHQSQSPRLLNSLRDKTRLPLLLPPSLMTTDSSMHQRRWPSLPSDSPSLPEQESSPPEEDAWPSINSPWPPQPEPTPFSSEPPRTEKPRDISVEHQVSQDLTPSHTSEQKEESSRRRRDPSEQPRYFHAVEISYPQLILFTSIGNCRQNNLI